MSETTLGARGALRVRDRSLPWGVRTYVMGIINVSPDSFSGDGDPGADAAARRALTLLAAGADCRSATPPAMCEHTWAGKTRAWSWRASHPHTGVIDLDRKSYEFEGTSGILTIRFVEDSVHRIASILRVVWNETWGWLFG